MDLDAYVNTHREKWLRLETLSKRSRLSGTEVDELVELYAQVGTHLSVIRAQSPDPQVVQYLSSLLSKARLRTLGRHTSTWRGAARFVTHTFPAALYRIRRWWLGATLGSVIATGLMIWWLYLNPSLEQSLMSPEQIAALVDHEFEDYYSEHSHGDFATLVWVNNAWVTALCIALGILGLPVFYLLFQNLSNLAVIGAIMHRNDHGAHFWGLLLPHGLLELTAVFVAAGTGLRLFWSWIEPGDLSRAKSIAREGRTAATIAVGLVGVLFVSGLVEGFVTPSGLPTWARVTIGALALGAFYVYALVLGRRAFEEGYDGDVDASRLEDTVISRA